MCDSLGFNYTCRLFSLDAMDDHTRQVYCWIGKNMWSSWTSLQSIIAGTVALAKKLGSVHVVWLLGQVLVQELFSTQMLESEVETVAPAKEKDAT
ncbi:hypothetical protein MRB53_034958 [Persea americana]|uniref:Uncharacterized protein n=1 Tax=Persea americana TaxID=3435 RepID=A0ACC2K3A6_PERAE|nr:hypothetical protein MRB53_034958 [Persea americana]